MKGLSLNHAYFKQAIPRTSFGKFTHVKLKLAVLPVLLSLPRQRLVLFPFGTVSQGSAYPSSMEQPLARLTSSAYLLCTARRVIFVVSCLWKVSVSHFLLITLCESRN